MRSLTLLLLFAVINGCAKAPEEPEIAVCSPIIYLSGNSLDCAQSYAYCTSSKDPTNPAKQIRKPLCPYLLSKPIMESPDDYTKLFGWIGDIVDWAGKYCKK